MLSTVSVKPGSGASCTVTVKGTSVPGGTLVTVPGVTLTETRGTTTTAVPRAVVSATSTASTVTVSGNPGVSTVVGAVYLAVRPPVATMVPTCTVSDTPGSRSRRQVTVESERLVSVAVRSRVCVMRRTEFEGATCIEPPPPEGGGGASGFLEQPAIAAAPSPSAKAAKARRLKASPSGA